MGNTVFTDAVPFTMDDILFSQQICPQLSVMSVLSAETLKRFSHYQNNLKAFVVCQDSVRKDLRKIDLSKISATPLDLSQKKIHLEETGVYLLVHVQRTPVSFRSSNSGQVCFSYFSTSFSRCSSSAPFGTGDQLLKGYDLASGVTDELPQWARVLKDVFTPRGVSMAFATNIGKPRSYQAPTTPLHNSNGSARNNNTTKGATHDCIDDTKSSRNGKRHNNDNTSDSNKNNGAHKLHEDDEVDFRYSVQIFTGVKADQIVASVAVRYACRIELCLLESPEVVRRLFFNYKVPRNAAEGLKGNAVSVPVGKIVGGRVSHSGLGLSEEYARNFLLRVLHGKNMRLPTPSTDVNGLPSFFNESLPHELFSGRVGPGSVSNYSSCHQSLQKNQSAKTSAANESYSLPVLDMQRLSTLPDLSQQQFLDHPLTTPRISNKQTGCVAQQQKNFSASAITSACTTDVSGTSPRLPVITKLRLKEALNARCENDASSFENDETCMMEERLQKLRAAAPHATEIFPWLFVGGEVAAKDRDQLLSKGITAVVNTVAFSMDNMFDDIFCYLGLYVSDSPDEPIFSLFPVVNRFVEEARISGGKTFIHCHQGVSRSCAFVIAYVMWYKGLCYDKAYELVRARRTICSPNAGFYVNLLMWEKHLSSPMLNKTYAYVPYPQYTFPFSFRPVLEFQSQQDTQIDYDSRIINSFLRTIGPTDENYAVDPRFSYGLLLADPAPRSAGCTEQPIFSFFFAGTECDKVLALRAKDDWEAFLRYGFYHGQKRDCSNHKGETVTFFPLPKLSRPTECLGALKKFGCVVEEHVFCQQRGSAGVSRCPHPVDARTACLDVLLAEHVAPFSAGRERCPGEKRQLPKLVTGGLAPCAFPNAHGNSSTDVFASKPDLSMRATFSSRQHNLAAPPHEFAANSAFFAAHSKGSCLTSHSSLSREATQRVEIYEYPFTSPPLFDILDVTDMRSERCYAIVIPSCLFAAEPVKGHQVFLWFGCACGVTEEEALDAYNKALKSGKDLRLWDGTLLKNPLEEIVRDGEEPDVLVLALES